MPRDVMYVLTDGRRDGRTEVGRKRWDGRGNTDSGRTTTGRTDGRTEDDDGRFQTPTV